MPLTVKSIEQRNVPGRYLDEHGLYLQVRPGGRKTWLYRYEVGGHERWMGLGSLADVTLAEARERARGARLMVRNGQDPINAKRAAKQKASAEAAALQAQSKTFAVVAQEYFDKHQTKWGNPKHKAQFLSTLELYAFPVFGQVPVADIDRALVVKVLDPIWVGKTETASRVRRRIENVLGFATIRGYRTGDNPAKWEGNLALAFPERAQVKKLVHHRALPYSELPAFIVELRKRESIAARAVEYLILTSTRTNEVLGAQWREIDIDQRVWVIPAERMKARLEHRVPLSGAAIALLKGLPREIGNPLVLVGPRKNGLSNMAMGAVLKRMGYRERTTIHGFRSTFRDWAAETTDHQNHIAEAALAHTIGDKVEAAYRRGDLFDKRRNLMEDWARYCENSGEKIAASKAA